MVTSAEFTSDGVTFTRLTTIPLAEIARHMSDPRVTEHMPLARGAWDEPACEAFVAAKEACWERDGLGHWAFLCDGEYVGWGGFQREGDEWDFGLVLRPEHFGLGLRIAARALELARADPRIDAVTFLLAPSRRHLRALGRLGARAIGEVEYEGTKFLKFELDTSGE